MRLRPIAFAPNFTLILILSLVGLGIGGCTSGDSNSESNRADGTSPGSVEEPIQSAADLAAGGQDPEVGRDAFSPQRTPTPDSAARPEELDSTRANVAQGSSAPRPQEPPTETVPPGFELIESTPTPVGVPELSGGQNMISAGQRELRDDLTADQLTEFLENSDRDMQLLASGRSQIQDPAEASKLMKQFATNKLQASIQLQQHPQATREQQIDGMRGQLQSLSHLAAMGDLDSAEALESLAKDNLESDEPSIAGDSRIVLIGFAIDRLRAGRESAGDEVVALIEGMQANPNPDVPAVLMMAEARQTLESYGMIDQAAKVREKILSLYGNSADPTIAKVAADAAGTAKFDPAKRLLSAILGDQNIQLSQWADAVTDLTSQSPDMNTVQFLGTAALQLEAAGKNTFVEKTFTLLSEAFTDADSATANEIETAKKAMEARRDVIGTPLDFDDLPSVDGAGVPKEAYENKIVLMPFWAVVVPESFQIVALLKEIQDQYPGKVAIVGMNIDPDQAPLREFLAQNDLGFPSYRSKSSATQSVANPVAARFGLVSLPFVAIFNQQGTVEALDFTGQQLQPVVDRLVESAE